MTPEERKERKLRRIKAWKLANADKVRKQRHDRYLANREKELARGKAYRAANKESSKEYDRKRGLTAKVQERKAKWRDDNRDHIKGYNKKYFQDNSESLKGRNSAWKKGNPEKVKANHAAYFGESKKRMTDNYMRSLITQKTSLRFKDIPQSLIKAKRAYIKGIRLIKEQEDEGQKD